jgi:hypothetical protein
MNDYIKSLRELEDSTRELIKQDLLNVLDISETLSKYEAEHGTKHGTPERGTLQIFLEFHEYVAYEFYESYMTEDEYNDLLLEVLASKLENNSAQKERSIT